MDVELIFGKACNIECKFCNNKNTNLDNSEYDDIPLSTIEFLKRVPTSLTFYGGETLLYWDHINEILTQYYNPDCEYYIITNGLYLDEDKINVLNEYGVNVILYKYYNTNLKNYDILEENKDNILKIDNISILYTLNSKDSIKDFLDDLNLIEKNYFFKYNKYFDIYIDFINMHDDIDKNLVNFDFNKIEEEARYICDHYNDDDNIAYKIFLDTLKMQYESDLTINAPCCRYGYNKVLIDLKGNYYACLDDIENNNCNIISNSINDALKLLKKKDKYKKRYNTICDECEVRNLCRNGCSLYTPSELEKYYCHIRKAFYKIIIEFFKNTLTEGEIKNDE